jgi:hypothetical protein
MANVTGWGRGTWGEATWGEPIPVEVTGIPITAELGNETITADADVPVTGTSLSITLDNVIIPNVEVFPIGISLSTTLDSVTTISDVDVTLSSLNLLSVELGNESITGTASVDITGTELTMVVNSVGIEAGGNVTIPVFENPMAMSLGDISLIISEDVFVTGNSLTTSLGNVDQFFDMTVDVTGQSLTATLDSVETISSVELTGLQTLIRLQGPSFIIDGNVNLTGLSMTTQVGSINNSYGWNIIDTGTSVVYTQVAA